MDLATLKQHWINPRRKRTWVITGLLLYTLLGFFLVPWIIKQQLVDMTAAEFERTLTVEKIRFNPYVLGLEIENLALRDPDDVVVFSLRRFYINLQLSGLFRSAWTFKEISLEAPNFLFERFAPADTRLSRMLAVAEEGEAGETDETAAAGLPGLLIYQLAISDGQLAISDHVPLTPVQTTFAPINIVINDLNTLPDFAGDQAVDIAMPAGGVLSWTGDLELVPFRSKGAFTLEDVNPAIGLAYLKDQFRLQDLQALVSSSFVYDIGVDHTGDFSAAISELSLKVADVSLTGFDPVTQFLGLREISLTGGSLSWPEQQVDVSNLALAGIDLQLWRTPEGEINLTTLLPAPSASEPMPADAQPWRVTLAQFEILDSSVIVEDRAINPVPTLPLQINQLRVTNLTNQPGARAGFTVDAAIDQGAIEAAGSMSLDTAPLFETNLDVTAIPMPLISPYIEQVIQAQLLAGDLTAALSVTLASLQSPSVSGGLQISDLRLRDKLADDTLVSWKQLSLDRFEYTEAGIKVSSIALTEPFARLAIDEFAQLNIAQLMIAQPDAETETVAGAPLDLTIGRVSLDAASLDFSDASLPLPFRALIQQLNGSVSTIATQSSEPALIALEGQVNDFGLSRISGTLNTFDPVRHTNMEVLFRNLAMSNYSPYTASFAGREIASGKLELSLKYQIDDGQLQGDHEVTLTDLMLGERVDHPDAASLPLGLAVSLLKDADGVIDIDLPVSGDMNDPQFEIGGVIFKAFSNLITKLVTAPFRLLGGLIGIDSEDLGNIEFDPGRADLTAPELEKIANLVRGLAQRPQLSLVLAGAAERRLDEPVLRLAMLRADVVARLDETYEPGEDMLDEEIVGVLEMLLAERQPDSLLEDIRLQHQSPPADDPEGRPQLDELAYLADLRDRLLDAIVVTDSQLIELANARATAIGDALLNPPALPDTETTGLPAERITNSEAVLIVASDEADRIIVALSVQ